MKTRFYIPLLVLALTACSNDELTNSLMREYPLEIEATGLQAVATPASTRATVDGNWDGVTSVALSVGDMTEVFNDPDAPFNGDKADPKILSTSTEVPAQAGVTATINDWTVVTSDPVEAM